jgi:hypothetical protein
MGLMALGATALCAAVWIFPAEWLFGDFTNNGVRDGLIATAIIVVPVFVSKAVEGLPTGRLKGRGIPDRSRDVEGV